MRAQPSTSAPRVKSLREGSELEIAGPDQPSEGRTWRNVRDPSDGAIGWVTGELLTVRSAAPAGGSAQQASAPAKPEAKPAGVSPDTQAYLDWLGPKIQLAGESLKAVATQSELAANNPRLIGNNDWRIKTAVTVAILETTGKEIQSYSGTVPQNARRLDTIVKDMGKDLVYIATEYTAGIDGLSTPRINNATNRMNTISNKTKLAITEIEAIRRP